MDESNALSLRSLGVPDEVKEQFVLACQQAGQLQLADNFGAAFTATLVVTKLRELLTDDVINKVFRPLMNTRVGFLTDHDPKRPRKDRNGNPIVVKEYDNNVIRDSIIEAASLGLQPTGNQFNIIADRMYPTKEGFTALLKRLGVKYVISIGADSGRLEGYAEIECKVDYKFGADKNSFKVVATVKKDSYSSPDQLRGKAERRAKKSLFEYLTGCDVGDADEDSARVEDGQATVVETKIATQGNKTPMPPENDPAPKNDPASAQPATQPVGSREVPPLFKG